MSSSSESHDVPVMITDKGFFDAVWCPKTWEDEFNSGYRVKPYRGYDPMESIHQALYVGASTQYVRIEEIPPLGRKAKPYRDSFWLHVPFREGQLLLTTHSFVLDTVKSGEGVLTVNRDKWYDPRDEEAYRAEIHLQVLIHRHVSKFFPRVREIEVISRYPSSEGQRMANPTPEDLVKADEFVSYINDQKDRKVELVPRYEKCPNCWWRGCPVLRKGKPDTNPSGKGSSV
jgi:hypothetical protein